MALMDGSHEKKKGTAGGSGGEERTMVGTPIKAKEEAADLELAKAVPPSRAESSTSSGVRMKTRQVRPPRGEGDAVQAGTERALEIAPLEVSSLAVEPLVRE